MKLCSACLLGIKCRYDGETKPDQRILDLAKKETLIPICPEQLGGLPTPRTPSEKVGEKILTQDNQDFTKKFQKGAEETLKIAKLFNITEAILKQKSPSCGCGKIYDGTFTGTIIEGDGVTTKLLKQPNIKVVSEEEF